MPFLPFPLFTDVLLWLLAAAVALYAWYCSRRPHLAAPWKRVFQSKAAMVCSVVLLLFVVIGLLDSFHYRPRLQGGNGYSPEVLSVLDLGLSHLRQRRERTYSAPLATRLYAKEQMVIDGTTVRDFPRLAHGGAHL
ncbi:MAG TPA: ABC transporter permease, partial [Burkholderiales bacterium]